MVELLIPLMIAAVFLALMLYTIWLQRRAVRTQRDAMASVAESLELQRAAVSRVDESLRLQRRSVKLEEQILEELRKLNGKA
jgi:predicted Holliday junction resolvase-like endonuclease